MKTKSRSFHLRQFLFASALSALFSAASFAQTSTPRPLNATAASTLVPATVPTRTSDFSIHYSFSPESDLERGGKIGDVEVSHFGFHQLLSTPISDGRTLLFGIFGSFTDLELTGSSPLPDELQQIGLTLGARKALGEWFGPEWDRWHLTALLRPNFTADSTSLSDSGFSVPASLSFNFKQSPTLFWDFGLNVNPQSDSIVMPLVGMRWDFAPQWTASLGFPQTGIAYKFSSKLTLQGGMRVQGGTYYIAETRASVAGDTWMDYREIRAGLGFDYQLTKQISVGVDAGTVVDRNFDYFDRDYEVDGGSAGYFAISLRARF